MISSRLCQSLHKAHLRCNVVFINSCRRHIHITIKHNLSRANLCGLSAAGERKCAPIFESSCGLSARHYSSESLESAGVVRLLRGFRKDWREELELPSPFAGFFHLYKLTKFFDEKFGAFFSYMAGFEQGFIVYMDLIRESNVEDLDRDWLLPEAQEDTKDILMKLPSDALTVATTNNYIFPVFLGYNVQRYDSSPFVDAAFFYPGVLTGTKRLSFWHVVYTRKFGPGVKDSWNIKAVALYMI